MAKRQVIKNPDPALRKKTRDITEFNSRLHTLLDDMLETLRLQNGVGLAAPQVGILRRCAIVEAEEGRVVELINPEIIGEGESVEGVEGCLSFPGVWGIVERPSWVKVKAQNRHGETYVLTAEGLEARAFCHEIDHLNGLVFVDKVIRYTDPYGEDDPENPEE